jgi:cysteinyl-tRNA synthetase
MHNGFVRLNDEKMSKSLGNFFTVREVLPRLRPEVLRAFLLSSHYRGPVNYAEDNLRQADAALQRLYLALRDVKGDASGDPPHSKGASPFESGASRRFAEAMNDDFNTPEALAAMQTLARDLNVAKSAGEGAKAAGFAAELRYLGGILGLLHSEPAAWLATRSELTGSGPAAAENLDSEEIDRLVQARIAARKSRDFAASDRIRDELAAKGVVLEDGPTGTTWRRK